MTRPTYTPAQMFEFAAECQHAAEWFRWHAKLTRDPGAAARDRALADNLEARGKGYVFQAREVLYDARGGVK